MQLARRRLSPGDLDHEFLWLSVSLGSLGLAAIWFGLGLPWPRCAFHDLTGLPCLSCGMTRSAVQFFHGHLLTAFQWNPLVFAILCGIVLFNAYALFVLATRAPRLRIVFQSPREKRCARIVVIAVLVVNWGYLLVHWRAY